MDYSAIKQAIDIGREYDRAIGAAYDVADSRDLDRLYNHIGQIVKEHSAGLLSDLEATRALRGATQ